MADKRISNCDAIEAALSLDGNPDHIKKFYQDWADTYNTDTNVAEWIGPGIVARMFREHQPDTDITILDAGCGTGFVGVELKNLGYGAIDGFDLSAPMAEQAIETGAYREVLGDIDMMLAADHYADASYDAVMSAGVFTLGHVPPEAMLVLLRLTRQNGLVVVTTRSHYYNETNFQQVIDGLLDAGRIEIVQVDKNVTYNNDGDGHYWVFRKLS